MAAVRDSYEHLEAVLHSNLSGLCSDAEWLKSYMAGELMLHKELMQVCSSGVHVKLG